MKKMMTILIIMTVALVLSPIANAMITADPDAYPVGTQLNNAFAGITLTALGSATNSDTRVLSYTSAYASTGTLVFGDPGESLNPTTWGNGGWDYLRVDFSQQATNVLLDFIANDSSDRNPVFEAYNSSDVLVDTDTEAGIFSSGDIVTLEVSASNIAYVLALGDPINKADSWTLDNLRYEVIPAPGAIMLGAIGTGIIGWFRRKRVL